MTSTADLDSVPKKLSGSKEFCLSPTFKPQFIDEVIYRGYFPMSIAGCYEHDYIMAVKCHTERCAVTLNQDLHIENSARKRSSKFQVSIDQAFNDVVKMVVQKHGENWLCPLIQKAFRCIYDQPNTFKSKIHSVEIWKDGVLVAGELGYCCGPIYTSLTGAFTLPGSGMVQLVTLGRLLEQSGYKIWDFGMSMSYKENLGGKTMPRKSWLDLYQSLRTQSPPPLKLEGKVDARSIIDFDRMVPEVKPNKPQQPKPKKEKKQKKRRIPPSSSTPSTITPLPVQTSETVHEKPQTPSTITPPVQTSETVHEKPQTANPHN
jgi:Leu/Phe-tRNA-protein transferase